MTEQMARPPTWGLVMCSALNKGTYPMSISYAPEVIADSSGNWVGNACRFATEDEAKAYASDLYSRWTLVTKTRVIPSDDPVNYRWQDGRAEPLKD